MAKTLVAYFSASGVTARLAKELVFKFIVTGSNMSYNGLVLNMEMSVKEEGLWRHLRECYREYLRWIRRLTI